ncbi:Nif11-like leader peptide family natural product precursor [Anabaena sp. UHCC 0399]|uniref:Nif11-like leader peptide family natural product precursor n=1 Tax=Anabaena sp. UHCC 0399 TaxID=3110238 RepID=UPI002B1F7D61|nr:Nif11-like leader peptide family natural product precursor [Anabaena sp. UHCC 0399]MEA5569335.1 Nif11-like leader peptide family natural product precursor [Anabaena sp. UHCC 0399]
MYYQIWNFFLKDDEYVCWKEKIKLNNIYSNFTWGKIHDFFRFVEKNFFLKHQLGETQNLAQFINVVTENGYNLTAEQLAWFLVTRKQIWEFFDLAQKTPTIKDELLVAKNPQQFVYIAANYGYYFTVDELAWLLTEIKSSPELVPINNSVGEIDTVSNYGKIEIGYWIWLAEEWGLVAPFCHKDPPLAFLAQYTDDPFLPDRCFLPKSYFNQHFVSQSK